MSKVQHGNREAKKPKKTQPLALPATPAGRPPLAPAPPVVAPRPGKR